MASKSRRAARAVVTRARNWDAPMDIVRDTDAAHVHRGLRKADRLADQGQRLASRGSLLELRLAARRMQARAHALELRALARIYADALEGGAEAASDLGWGPSRASRPAAVDFALREAASECAATGRDAPSGAEGRLAEAFDLVTRFEATVCALEEGLIWRRHAEVIGRIGTPLEDDAKRAEYKRILLDAAGDKTHVQLEQLAKRVVEQFRTTSLQERHDEARKQRCVWIGEEEDGMSTLTAYLPALEANAIFANLTTAARQQQRITAEAITDAKDRGDRDAAEMLTAEARTLGELRADLLAEFVLSADPATIGSPDGARASIRANLDVVVSTNAIIDDLVGGTLTERNEFALLNGRIPVPVPVSAARELLSTCTSFTRVLTDPFTGMVTSVDTRSASKPMKDFLRIRDAHCRWPGCTLTATRCELDHTIAVEDGGPTCLSNMESLCKGHHLLKHQTRWDAEQRADGVMRYTSPTGREFTTVPEPVDPDFLLGRPPGAEPPGEDSAVMANAGPPSFRPTDDDPAPF